MEESDLDMRLGFKENEILRGPTPIVSPFMANLERHTALHVYTDIIQNQLVGDVTAPLYQVVPVKSRYGGATCVTYEKPMNSSTFNIQTVEINIMSDTSELVSFENGKSIVTLAFRRESLFHWCINYQYLKKQHIEIKRFWYWRYIQRVDKNVFIFCEEESFKFEWTDFFEMLSRAVQ